MCVELPDYKNVESSCGQSQGLVATTSATAEKTLFGVQSTFSFYASQGCSGLQNLPVLGSCVYKLDRLVTLRPAHIACVVFMRPFISTRAGVQ